MPVSVTFNSGETEQTFTFIAVHDTVDDDDESIKLTFGALPTAVSEGIPNESAVSINDDDDPQATVSFAQASYTVAESDDPNTTNQTENEVEVTVTLSADPERTVIIPLTATEQNGATTADYNGVPGNVEFTAGETEKSFIFTATDDTLDDDDESIKIAFGTLPTGVSQGTTTETVMTIADDDDPAVMVNFEQSSYTVAESDDPNTNSAIENQAAIKVTLSANPERTVIIPITKADQNGATSADYSGVPASVTFNSGETEKTFIFSATHDAVDDDEESVKLAFGDTLPAGVSAGTTDETTVTITDDDVPTVTANFEQGTYTVAEGGSVTVKVKLDIDPERTVTIPLTSGEQNGATSADYSGVPVSVVFNSGETEKSFSFTAAQDALDDDDESVKLIFGTLPTGVNEGTTKETVVTITDDDVPSISVSFEHSSYTVAESDDSDTIGVVENEVTIKVILSADPERTVTINLAEALQGEASSGDYSGVPASLEFAADETEQTFVFSATDDTVDDDGESVKLGFGTLPTGVSEGTTKETVITIVDDDVPVVTVSYEQASYTVGEGNNITVKMKLSADPERTATIPITAANQNGATSADYSGVPANVTFNSGDTEKSITFTATADDVDDDGESVKLGFGALLPTGVTAGTPSETTLTITDDDVPSVSVGFEQSSYTVAESDDTNTTSVDESQVTVKVQLSADPERTVTIPITATNQDGATAADYSGVPASLEFNAGDTEKSFTFSAAADTTDDDDESVKLTFGTLPAGVSEGVTNQSIVSITDDDVPSVNVSYGAIAYTVAESDDTDTADVSEDEVEITVTLDADPERTVIIPITLTNQGGATSADYSGVPASVTFNSGDTEKTFTLVVTADALNDDDESVKLSFGTLPSGVSEGTPDETTITIMDDDVPSVSVTFEQDSYTVAESDDPNTPSATENQVTIKVNLSSDPERTVAIPIAKTDQGGATSSDYSGIPVSVEFNAGETEKTFIFTATHDTLDDDDESLKLTFGTLPTSVTEGVTKETVVSITDDDVPAVIVSFDESSYTVAESDDTSTIDTSENQVTIKIILSADPERTVVIPVTTTNQNGATQADYSGIPASVTFDSGETEQTFIFLTTHDTLDDDGESVKLGLGLLPNRVSDGTTAETIISILDDDDPSLSASFEEASYIVAESDDPDTADVEENQVIIKIILSADPERTVTIPLTTTNQNGATAADYGSVPVSLVFNSGETEKSFPFTAIADTADDDGESVKFTFGILPTGVSQGTPDETTVSIADDDVPDLTVSYGSATYSVDESDDTDTNNVTENETTVTVTLSADPERTVTIPITVTEQDGATSADYGGVPTGITFNSDETQKTFTFAAAGDSIDDNGESVELTFGTLPSGVSEGTTATTTISITDDDTAGVSISHTDLEVPEGGEATYTIKLDTQPTDSVTVSLGGDAGTDLTLDNTSLTFTVTNWSMAQSVKVTAAEDTDALDDSITLTHATSSDEDTLYDGIAVASLDVTVLDNETETKAIGLTMGAPLHTDTDGSGDVNLGDTLTYTATATNSGNVPLENVNVKDLLIDTNGTDCATLALGAECTLTGAHTISQNDVDAGEVSNTATATADGASDKMVSQTTNVVQVMELTLEKTSTESGFDQKADEIPYSYKAINSGTTTLKGTIGVTDDKMDSDDITCPTVPTAGLAPSAALTCTATYTITQDDVDAGEVKNTATVSLGGVISSEVSLTISWIAQQGDLPTISIGGGSVGEGAGTIEISVTVSTSSLQTITVDYETANVTATAGEDYTANTGTLTFNPGDTTKSVTVAITDDDIDEDNESFKVTLSDPVNATVPTGTEDGTFTITDDDTAGVSISHARLPVPEGGSASYTVVLDSEPAGNVTVTPGGISDTDLSLDETSLTFTSENWDTAQSVEVTAAQDDGDDDESATITHTVTSSDDSDYNGITAASVEVNITDDDDTEVTVGFEQSSYTVAEASNVTVKVKLNKDPERTVIIPIVKTDQGGITSSDYSGVPANVTFNSGDTEKSFTFTATSDGVDDDDESVKLSFGTLPTSVTEGTVKETVVTITDDDVPAVTVSFEHATYTVAESDDASTLEIAENEVSIKVTLNVAPERTVTIPVTLANQGGATADDYSGVPEDVEFAPGDTEKTFVLMAIHDTLDDDGESVKLTFGTLPTDVTAGTTTETIVTISDDDDPSVTASFEHATYTVDESDDPNTTSVSENQVTIKILLSADPERTATVPLTTTNQGGATAADYSGVPASVIFNSGETEKTFVFSASHDTLDDDESVKIGFGALPVGIGAGSTDETVVTITDDDAPSVTVSFEQTTYSVAESDDPNTADIAENEVTIKVKLSIDPERTVTVPITTTDQNGATAADYSEVPASVVFNIGDTEKSFTFIAAHDSADDDDESVKLGFGPLPTGVSEGSPEESVVTINDDDDPAVTVSYASATYAVAESDDTDTTETTENEVEVTVSLSANPERTIIIPITATNQGGATAADYSGVPTGITFNSGETEKSFIFSATEDSVNDDDESVKLTFGALPSGVSEGVTNETIVTITDDDVPSLTANFEQATYSVAESDDPNTTNVSENQVTIKVTLSGDPERSVTVLLSTTLQGGATSADYSGVPTGVTFGSDETEQTFIFTATADTLDDDDESVKLSFGTLPAGVSEGTTKDAVIAIADDDVPAVTVSYEQGSYTVAEGSNVTVKVKLSEAPERTVIIPITKAEQGGAVSADYSGVPANITFNSGDTEKSITFDAAADDVDDDGESVKLAFGSTLPTGITAGSPDETTVTITDDDVPSVTVSFELAAYSVDESDDTSTADEAENEVTVTVTLSADPERTVVIPITKTGQNGVTTADYSGVPASITFNSGDTEKTFVFMATADTVDDDGESVKLTFGTLPTGVAEGTVKETVVSINDDDLPASVSVQFEQATYTVAEGNSVAIKVKLSEDPEQNTTIPITATNQGGATSVDYSGVPSDVSFAAGETEKSFTFSATGDTTDDDGESVKLTFGSLPTGIEEGSTDESVVSITDDDVPSVSVSFEMSSYDVSEGDDLTIKVKLSADPERTVTIPLSTTNQGGATSADFSGVPVSVVFNSGETEKSFIFSATQDTIDDDGEGVKLGFGTMPAAVTAGTTDESVVSITDDDVPSVNVNYGSATYGVEESDDISTTSVVENEVEISLTLSADPERTVIIPITITNQGGVTSADYSGVPTSVTFNSGNTEQTFTFVAAADTTDDDGESVKLTFGTLPAGVSAGITNESIVTIGDDDVPSVNVNYGAILYMVSESDDPDTPNATENQATIKVQLSADPERTVTIPIAKTDQGGATSADYSGVPASVEFVAGETEQTFIFSATHDTVNDDSESVKLSFGTLPTGVSEGLTNETVVSITDDDETIQEQMSVMVSFETAGYFVTEGGTTEITIELSAGPAGPLSIPITATNGAGVTSGDYSGVPASVDFASGETEKSFTFTAVQDAVDENLEEVTLGFGTLPAGVSSASPAQASVTIYDSIHVSFGTNYYQAYEGGTGATVTVKLDRPAATEIVIPITATGMNGADSDDWTGVPADLTFDAGDTEKTFAVFAYDDSVEDDGETVILGFGTLPSGVAPGDPNVANVELMNKKETERTDYGCPKDSGMRIVFDSYGEITQVGESEFWRVQLDPYRVYIVELLGEYDTINLLGEELPDDGLTMDAPRLLSVWNDERTVRMRHTSHGNNIYVTRASSPTGWHQFEVNGNGETGTYRITFRVSNVCVTSDGYAQYPYFGGPDGYVLDTPMDTSTRREIHPHHKRSGDFLGDNWSWYWEEIPDVDWHASEAKGRNRIRHRSMGQQRVSGYTPSN